jgi:hypothetical protein
MTLGLTLLLYPILPSGYFEAEARCPNGYHADESGECEKVTNNKGKPRCPDGYHRSPDGDCERVNNGGSSSKSNNDDDDDDDEADKKKSSKKNTEEVPFESESNDPQSYSNSKLGISLEHPLDWKFGSLKNGIQLIKEKNGVYVEVRKHNLESPDMQLTKYVADYIKDRSTSREDFKLLNITETTISGNLPAYKAIYTFLKTENQNDFTTGDTTNKILRIWTFTQDNAYLVAFVADKDKYDLYLPIAEEIIDTFKINSESQQSSSDNDSNDNDNDNDSNDNDNDNDSNDNDNDNDSNEGNDGGDKDCSDFDKKNFKVQPGDPYDLDRDGDGIACES